MDNYSQQNLDPHEQQLMYSNTYNNNQIDPMASMDPNNQYAINNNQHAMTNNQHFMENMGNGQYYPNHYAMEVSAYMGEQQAGTSYQMNPNQQGSYEQQVQGMSHHHLTEQQQEMWSQHQQQQQGDWEYQQHLQHQQHIQQQGHQQQLRHTETQQQHHQMEQQQGLPQHPPQGHPQQQQQGLSQHPPQGHPQQQQQRLPQHQVQHHQLQPSHPQIQQTWGHHPVQQMPYPSPWPQQIFNQRHPLDPRRQKIRTRQMKQRLPFSFPESMMLPYPLPQHYLNVQRSQQTPMTQTRQSQQQQSEQVAQQAHQAMQQQHQQMQLQMQQQMQQQMQMQQRQSRQVPLHAHQAVQQQQMQHHQQEQSAQSSEQAVHMQPVPATYDEEIQIIATPNIARQPHHCQGNVIRTQQQICSEQEVLHAQRDGAHVCKIQQPILSAEEPFNPSLDERFPSLNALYIADQAASSMMSEASTPSKQINAGTASQPGSNERMATHIPSTVLHREPLPQQPICQQQQQQHHVGESVFPFIRKLYMPNLHGILKMGEALTPGQQLNAGSQPGSNEMAMQDPAVLHRQQLPQQEMPQERPQQHHMSTQPGTSRITEALTPGQQLNPEAGSQPGSQERMAMKNPPVALSTHQQQQQKRQLEFQQLLQQQHRREQEMQNALNPMKGNMPAGMLPYGANSYTSYEQFQQAGFPAQRRSIPQRLLATTDLKKGAETPKMLPSKHKNRKSVEETAVAAAAPTYPTPMENVNVTELNMGIANMKVQPTHFFATGYPLIEGRYPFPGMTQNSEQPMQSPHLAEMLRMSKAQDGLLKGEKLQQLASPRGFPMGVGPNLSRIQSNIPSIPQINPMAPLQSEQFLQVSCQQVHNPYTDNLPGTSNENSQDHPALSALLETGKTTEASHPELADNFLRDHDGSGNFQQQPISNEAPLIPSVPSRPQQGMASNEVATERRTPGTPEILDGITEFEEERSHQSFNMEQQAGTSQFDILQDLQFDELDRFLSADECQQSAEAEIAPMESPSVQDTSIMIEKLPKPRIATPSPPRPSVVYHAPEKRPITIQRQSEPRLATPSPPRTLWHKSPEKAPLLLVSQRKCAERAQQKIADDISDGEEEIPTRTYRKNKRGNSDDDADYKGAPVRKNALRRGRRAKAAAEKAKRGKSSGLDSDATTWDAPSTSTDPVRRQRRKAVVPPEPTVENPSLPVVKKRGRPKSKHLTPAVIQPFDVFDFTDVDANAPMQPILPRRPSSPKIAPSKEMPTTSNANTDVPRTPGRDLHSPFIDYAAEPSTSSVQKPLAVAIDNDDDDGPRLPSWRSRSSWRITSDDEAGPSTRGIVSSGEEERIQRSANEPIVTPGRYDSSDSEELLSPRRSSKRQAAKNILKAKRAKEIREMHQLKERKKQEAEERTRREQEMKAEKERIKADAEKVKAKAIAKDRAEAAKAAAEVTKAKAENEAHEKKKRRKEEKRQRRKERERLEMEEERKKKEAEEKKWKEEEAKKKRVAEVKKKKEDVEKQEKREAKHRRKMVAEENKRKKEDEEKRKREIEGKRKKEAEDRKTKENEARKKKNAEEKKTKVAKKGPETEGGSLNKLLLIVKTHKVAVDSKESSERQQNWPLSSPALSRFIIPKKSKESQQLEVPKLTVGSRTLKTTVSPEPRRPPASYSVLYNDYKTAVNKKRVDRTPEERKTQYASKEIASCSKIGQSIVQKTQVKTTPVKEIGRSTLPPGKSQETARKPSAISPVIRTIPVSSTPQRKPAVANKKKSTAAEKNQYGPMDAIIENMIVTFAPTSFRKLETVRVDPPPTRLPATDAPNVNSSMEKSPVQQKMPYIPRTADNPRNWAVNIFDERRKANKEQRAAEEAKLLDTDLRQKTFSQERTIPPRAETRFRHRSNFTDERSGRILERRPRHSPPYKKQDVDVREGTQIQVIPISLPPSFATMPPPVATSTPLIRPGRTMTSGNASYMQPLSPKPSTSAIVKLNKEDSHKASVQRQLFQTLQMPLTAALRTTIQGDTTRKEEPQQMAKRAEEYAKTVAKTPVLLPYQYPPDTSFDQDRTLINDPMVGGGITFIDNDSFQEQFKERNNRRLGPLTTPSHGIADDCFPWENNFEDRAAVETDSDATTPAFENYQEGCDDDLIGLPRPEQESDNIFLSTLSDNMPDYIVFNNSDHKLSFDSDGLPRNILESFEEEEEYVPDNEISGGNLEIADEEVIEDGVLDDVHEFSHQLNSEPLSSIPVYSSVETINTFQQQAETVFLPRPSHTQALPPRPSLARVEEVLDNLFSSTHDMTENKIMQPTELTSVAQRDTGREDGEILTEDEQECEDPMGKEQKVSPVGSHAVFLKKETATRQDLMLMTATNQPDDRESEDRTSADISSTTIGAGDQHKLSTAFSESAAVFTEDLTDSKETIQESVILEPVLEKDELVTSRTAVDTVFSEVITAVKEVPVVIEHPKAPIEETIVTAEITELLNDKEALLQEDIASSSKMEKPFGHIINNLDKIPTWDDVSLERSSYVENAQTTCLMPLQPEEINKLIVQNEETSKEVEILPISLETQLAEKEDTRFEETTSTYTVFAEEITAPETSEEESDEDIDSLDWTVKFVENLERQGPWGVAADDSEFEQVFSLVYEHDLKQTPYVKIPPAETSCNESFEREDVDVKERTEYTFAIPSTAALCSDVMAVRIEASFARKDIDVKEQTEFTQAISSTSAVCRDFIAVPEPLDEEEEIISSIAVDQEVEDVLEQEAAGTSSMRAAEEEQIIGDEEREERPVSPAAETIEAEMSPLRARFPSPIMRPSEEGGPSQEELKELEEMERNPRIARRPMNIPMKKPKSNQVGKEETARRWEEMKAEEEKKKAVKKTPPARISVSEEEGEEDDDDEDVDDDDEEFIPQAIQRRTKRNKKQLEREESEERIERPKRVTRRSAQDTDESSFASDSDIFAQPSTSKQMAQRKRRGRQPELVSTESESDLSVSGIHTRSRSQHNSDFAIPRAPSPVKSPWSKESTVSFSPLWSSLKGDFSMPIIPPTEASSYEERNLSFSFEKEPEKVEPSKLTCKLDLPLPRKDSISYSEDYTNVDIRLQSEEAAIWTSTLMQPKQRSAISLQAVQKNIKTVNMRQGWVSDSEDPAKYDGCEHDAPVEKQDGKHGVSCLLLQKNHQLLKAAELTRKEDAITEELPEKEEATPSTVITPSPLEESKIEPRITRNLRKRKIAEQAEQEQPKKRNRSYAVLLQQEAQKILQGEEMARTRSRQSHVQEKVPAVELSELPAKIDQPDDIVQKTTKLEVQTIPNEANDQETPYVKFSVTETRKRRAPCEDDEEIPLAKTKSAEPSSLADIRVVSESLEEPEAVEEVSESLEGPEDIAETATSAEEIPVNPDGFTTDELTEIAKCFREALVVKGIIANPMSSPYRNHKPETCYTQLFPWLPVKERIGNTFHGLTIDLPPPMFTDRKMTKEELISNKLAVKVLDPLTGFNTVCYVRVEGDIRRIYYVAGAVKGHNSLYQFFDHFFGGYPFIVHALSAQLKYHKVPATKAEAMRMVKLFEAYIHLAQSGVYKLCIPMKEYYTAVDLMSMHSPLEVYEFTNLCDLLSNFEGLPIIVKLGLLMHLDKFFDDVNLHYFVEKSSPQNTGTSGKLPKFELRIDKNDCPFIYYKGKKRCNDLAKWVPEAWKKAACKLYEMRMQLYKLQWIFLERVSQTRTTFAIRTAASILPHISGFQYDHAADDDDDYLLDNQMFKRDPVEKGINADNEMIFGSCPLDIRELVKSEGFADVCSKTPFATDEKLLFYPARECEIVQIPGKYYLVEKNKDAMSQNPTSFLPLDRESGHLRRLLAKGLSTNDSPIFP